MSRSIVTHQEAAAAMNHALNLHVIAYEDFGKAWDAVRGHANNADDIIDKASASRELAVNAHMAAIGLAERSGLL